MIYLDYAASSWPKPASVVVSVAKAINEYAANPGRGSHSMALQASRAIFQARMRVAKLFNVKNPNDIILTKNTTEALNLALFGYLCENDHVVCTDVEHNSIRRPLEYLKQTKAIQVTYLKHDEQGLLNYDSITNAIQSNTTLLICTHGSNVLGSIVDLEKIKERLQNTKIKLLVDAAQTAGHLKIDVERLGIDMLAFPGHKSLLGPQGTGGLYVRDSIELKPLLYGGTGNRSEELIQPINRPEGYESGTLNTPGFAGLSAGIEYVQKNFEKINQKEHELTNVLLEGLYSINEIKVLGPKPGEHRCSLVSFVHQKIESAELSFILDQHYQIAVRAGFHCAPMAHHLAGTIQTGAVRASIGWATTKEDVDRFLFAISEINEQYN